MATASVGKTTAGQTDDNNSLCDACEDHTASKYCLVCPGPLCDNCIQSHRKSKLTKDHKLCDLPLSRLGSSYIRSGEPPEGLRKCPKHQDKEMDHFCGNCICFVCTSCKGEHSGHKTYLARDDISAHRTVYNNHMKRLLDESHDLEQYKINLETIIQNSEETCTEVDHKADHLITEIKENSNRLKGELRTVQGEFKKLLGDAENGLIKEMKYADDEISKFQVFRKTDDCDVISHALASSEEVLNKLSEYKKEITPVVRTPPTKKILTYETEIDSIQDYVRSYFVMETPFTPTISAKMSNTNKLYINNPKGRTGYRFCKSCIKDNLIIYGTFSDNIRLLDKNYAEKEQITYETDIWNMVTVSNDKHVVLSKWGDSEISLLDANFKFISKQYQSPKQRIRAICYYGPNQFVMCETGDAAYFSIMLVKDKTFVKLSEIKIADIGRQHYMDLYPDKEHCLVGTDTLLYKVSLKKSTFTKHDVSAFIRLHIWSPFVDDNGHALVGDEVGNVHKFDEMMNHELITNIGHPVRDILVKGDRLLVSSMDDKIYEYL